MVSESVNRVLGKLPDAKREGRGWKARCPCPVHRDDDPSLSINEGDGGRTLVNCFGGCATTDVMTALGLTMADLMPAQPQSRRSRPSASQKDIVAVYPYHDEAGTLLYEVVKFAPKRFAQRRPNGQDNYVWRLNGVRRVLYRLPELLGADPGETVFVTEGEKDADRLRELGLVATTNSQGACKWNKVDHTPLHGRRVVIVPDNDASGRKHAQQVAEALHVKAAEVRIVELPGLPEKGDVSDWLEAGGTVDQLHHLAEQSEPFAPEGIQVNAASDEARTDSGTTPLTDLGNAQRLVSAHGADLRYCYSSKTWLVWDDQRWVEDVTGAVIRTAKETVRSMYESASGIVNDDQRTALISHAQRSESEARLKAMIELAKSEPSIPVTPDLLDSDPWLLNVLNGTIDLRTGRLIPHERKHLITKLAPVAYGPDARLSAWDEFLAQATGADPELSGFLQRGVGYCLTGNVSEEVIFFIHGPAATGKSTFLESIKAVLGEYARTADFETFLSSRRTGGPRNDIARLAGSRLVASIEVDQGKRLAEGLVKMITGGDTVTARHLYRESFEFRPTFKLWLSANHAPRIYADDDAMWRRILRVPFEQIIPKADRDPRVKATLCDPAKAGPAILSWAVKGCLEWQERGLAVPDIVQKATDAYRLEEDPIREFVEDCCNVEPNAWTATKDLRKAYKGWCEENDVHQIGDRAFRELLKVRGCSARSSNNVRGWRGIGLRN